MKTCSRCNIDKEINRFHKSSGDKYTNLQALCSKINRDIKGATI